MDIDNVRKAVEKEMSGPGSLLGYRALYQKIHELHGLSVPSISITLNGMDAGIMDGWGDFYLRFYSHRLARTRGCRWRSIFVKPVALLIRGIWSCSTRFNKPDGKHFLIL